MGNTYHFRSHCNYLLLCSKNSLWASLYSNDIRIFCIWWNINRRSSLLLNPSNVWSSFADDMSVPFTIHFHIYILQCAVLEFHEITIIWKMHDLTTTPCSTLLQQLSIIYILHKVVKITVKRTHSMSQQPMKMNIDDASNDLLV